MKIHHLTALLAAAATFATANPDTGGQKPWEISRLTTFSPPNRPGSSPWNLINITIADPNDDPVAPVDCGATWTLESPPYGQVHDCSEVAGGGGQWAFTMLESDSPTASPTTDFVLRFTLAKNGETYIGTEAFAVGDNMSGLCSAGGVCSFGLKEELIPFPVHQKRVV